jgi:hypothetical protein
MRHVLLFRVCTDAKKATPRESTPQCLLLLLCMVVMVIVTPHVHSFVPPNKNSNGAGKSNHHRLNFGHRKGSCDGAAGNGGSGGSNNNHIRDSFFADGADYGDIILRMQINVTDRKNDSTSSCLISRGNTWSKVRGGGKLTKEKPDLLTSTTTYWQTTFSTVTRTLTKPFRLLKYKLSNMMKSKETIEEEEMMQEIRTMKVQSVIVPNTKVLPKDVIDIAAKRTSLLGNPLRTEYVQDFAQSMKRWYVRQGYILHSVTGATLQPETATVEIAVQEPIHHTVPINITYYKEMIIDPDTGDVTTYRQYKDKHVRRKSFGLQEKINKSNLNVTYVPALTAGHVRPSKIAKALHMEPGQPFQWDPTKWEIVQKSGLFSKVLQITPRAVVGVANTPNENAVQLQIVATEAPTKHLEYGVGKNLYNNGWEGELDFEHMNILGGGETLGINIRRGTTDIHPSMRCRYSTGRLQETGGYDIEAFNEYIGGVNSGGDRSRSHKGKDVVAATTTVEDDNDETASKQDVTNDSSSPDDSLLDRRGATIRIKNPIDPNTIRNSVFSASMERTSSSGTYETIGSTTMEVGPFLRELPMNARSNFDLSITTGARFGSKRHKLITTTVPDITDDDTNSFDAGPSSDSVMHTSSSSSSNSIIPYATMSATTRQLFPLLNGNKNRNRYRRGRNIISTSNSINNDSLSVSGGSSTDPFGLQQRSPSASNNDNVIGRPLILALKHTMIVSSNTIPQHVGKAIATSTNVRGYAIPDQSFSTALRGTTELRVPLYLPSIIPNEKIQQFFEQDANIVVYSDWLLSLKENTNANESPTATTNDSKNSLFNRKSCIGIGLRKSIQGIPLQYDVTYSNEGKLKAMFGLGRDFVF